MAGPLAGLTAGQIAEQTLPDQAAKQGSKQGPSKFDQAMKSSGGEVNQAQQVDPAQQVEKSQHAQRVHHLEHARQIEQVGKLDQANLQKANAGTVQDNNLTGKGMDPITQKQEVSKTGSLINGMVANIEKGQVQLDQLINGGLSGKNFSNSELLGLQAGMYKYTQELDLCSKVVEKATSGLKDTLKTQV